MCFFQRYRFVCIYTSLIDLYINYIYITVMLYMCIVTYIICRLYIDLAVSFMVLQKSSPRFSPVDFFLGFAVLSFPGEP